MERKQLNICASVGAITYTSRHTWSPTARASCLFNGILNMKYFSLHLLLTDATHTDFLPTTGNYLFLSPNTTDSPWYNFS